MMKLLPSIVFIFTIFHSVQSNAQDFATGTLLIETAQQTHMFKIEIAKTHQQKMQGLMYRDKMDDDAGMLFDYGYPQRVAMWMKNTFISLDMLFIDKDGTIRKIAQRTTPESLQSIYSGSKVVAVLELKGGTADKLSIKVGDKVLHAVFKNN